MKINVIGKINSGVMTNWFIIIKDDLENTGGYLVIQSQNSDFEGKGYDNCFENLQEVEQYIEYKDLSIKWFND